MTEETTIDPQEQARQARRQRAMNFWQHLDELRKRLMRAVIGVVIGTIIAAIYTNQALDLLLIPMGDTRPVALHPTETFVVFFRIAVLLGLVLAMPYIVYQFLAFLVPALTKKERRSLVFSVFAIGIFFAGGVIFSALIMVPLAVGYLSNFLGDIVQASYSIDNYISFVTTIMLSTGLVFETPLVLALLARMGVVTASQLAKSRRYALLAIAVLAAVITPTPDAFNMLITMTPLLVLYEVGIVMAWFAGRARNKALVAAGIEV